MGFDLGLYYSHPNKSLKEHINGVKGKVLKHTDSKIAEYAALFHDIGKLNPNFQKKLVNKCEAYSQHSYLSAYAFLSWYEKNRENGNRLFGIEGNDITKIKMIAAIILHHHGNLPNMDQNQTTTAFEEMKKFIILNYDTPPFSEYLTSEIGFIHSSFKLKEHSWFKLNIPSIDLGRNSRKHEIEYWQNNSLDNFLETQFSFASLIESDKRDAGNNERYNFKESIRNCQDLFGKALENKFLNLKAELSNNDLNRVRTEIRDEAVKSVSNLLHMNKRVFTLTAPTGAGKTFILLDLAKEIQNQKGYLGIIYSLPYLSITDQVQSIISQDLGMDDILIVNSKSINERLEQAQQRLEYDQSEDNIKALLEEDFIEATFDHPFVITTFVQLFETFLSNRNSTLLKLPNFANRIFLIDEIQALPPRLYIFFVAWLDAFCKRHNSFAICSTATMPYLSFPDKPEFESTTNYRLKNPKTLFKTYEKPTELLKPEKYFGKEVFNRYKVNFVKEDWTIDNVIEKIETENDSVLVILNTIQDTKDLYGQLKELPNVFLLNTHFIPYDRLAIIEKVKTLLPLQKVILISTQLIEAGVDIDFPIVYRDLSPLPSLIQSAGRCNRNNKLRVGKVVMFKLLNNRRKYSSEIIYRYDAKSLLDFVIKNVPLTINEIELFTLQQQFFEQIAHELQIGKYPEENMNLIEEINNAQFETVGKFKMINSNQYGNVFQLYVPESASDENFEILEQLTNSIKNKSYFENRQFKIKLNNQLKRMSGRIVSIRLRDISKLPPLANPNIICGLRKLNCDAYCKRTGVKLDIENSLL